MLEINAEKFIDQTLLPPSEEFPLGFGKKIIPESGSPLDLEIWIVRNIANIISATREWGALVIPKVKFAPTYYCDSSFVAIKDPSWAQVPNFQLQWSWHSDLVPDTIVLAHLEDTPARELATGVAPTSLIDRAVQQQARLELAGDPNGQFSTFFKKLSAEKYRYSDGSRISMIDEQFWPNVTDWDLARKLKEFYIDMNANLQQHGHLLSHNWVNNPGSALLFHNDNENRPHLGVSTAVHCCLLDPEVENLSGEIWKKELKQ